MPETLVTRLAPVEDPAPEPPRPGEEWSVPAADLRERAAAAGLPGHLVDALPRGATSRDLHEVLAGELPPVPDLPDSPGDLLVVVGAARDALVTARSLATRLGLGPDAVTVAARPGAGAARDDLVRDAVAARRAAAQVRLGEEPGIVVVQVDCDHADVVWARDVVAALRADQVHAVVDATRKSTDTERWVDTVFAVDPDAVHVVRAEGSADPGTALGLDLPVAGLDGGAGGAMEWARLLLREVPEVPAAAPVRARRRRSGR